MRSSKNANDGLGTRDFVQDSPTKSEAYKKSALAISFFGFFGTKFG
jgi:hypothetical protein